MAVSMVSLNTQRRSTAGWEIHLTTSIVVSHHRIPKALLLSLRTLKATVSRYPEMLRASKVNQHGTQQPLKHLLILEGEQEWTPLVSSYWISPPRLFAALRLIPNSLPKAQRGSVFPHFFFRRRTLTNASRIGVVCYHGFGKTF